MEYTIIVNGQSYDLPKKTITVMSELDEVLRIDSNTKLSLKQKYEKLHVFVKKLFGDDAAKEMLGTDNLAEVDLSELALIIRQIDDAYMRPITEYSTRKAAEDINALNIDKVVELVKLADKMPNQAAR